MEVFITAADIQAYTRRQRERASRVGLVPTMGALHAGHLSLVRASREHCDHTIATIFVNPTQFGPGEDLDQYPRTLPDDLEQLRAAGASAVFVPDATQIYPPGFSTSVNPPAVAQPLEGEFRPGHFAGVATVVLKLFHLIPATHAFFGRKDFQQLRVIETMVHDLNVPIEIVPCPIVRDADGLAMSSRNRYLDAGQRTRARRLSEALREAAAQFRSGQRDPVELERSMRAILCPDQANAGVDSIDYAVVVDANSLHPLERIESAAVALIAAHVGSTRLIDNQLLTPER